MEMKLETTLFISKLSCFNFTLWTHILVCYGWDTLIAVESQNFGNEIKCGCCGETEVLPLANSVLKRQRNFVMCPCVKLILASDLRPKEHLPATNFLTVALLI